MNFFISVLYSILYLVPMLKGAQSIQYVRDAEITALLLIQIGNVAFEVDSRSL